MAVTGFWPVKSRLKDVLSYAENPEKTADRDLSDVLRYAANEDKTERTLYVSAINCPKQRAYQCMVDTKKRFGKLSGNVAYHGVQSFKTGEVTPEEAHKIGMETAKRMWGDLYEVVVTTHLNTDNLHCHFVVNSVSFKTGRKFENHVSDHIKLREISDAVCREYGKSVIPFDHFYGNKKAYWVKDRVISHREQLRMDLDEMLANSIDIDELVYRMECLGYRFERGLEYEHPSVIGEGWQRPVRLDSLGKKYSADGIADRLEYNNRNQVHMIFKPIVTNRRPLKDRVSNYRRAKEENSLVLLFDVFLDILWACLQLEERHYDERPYSPELRAEIKKFEEYAADYEFMSRNNIETYDDLCAARDKAKEQIQMLEHERYKLRLKLRRVKTPEEKAEIKQQCKEITQKLYPLRKSVKNADRIEERSIRIKKMFEKEAVLERIENEPYKTKTRSLNR